MQGSVAVGARAACLSQQTTTKELNTVIYYITAYKFPFLPEKIHNASSVSVSSEFVVYSKNQQ